MASYSPARTRNVSCQKPVRPWGSRRKYSSQVGRCRSPGSRAKASRCSKLRQYCTIVGKPMRYPSRPFSGWATNSSSIAFMPRRRPPRSPRIFGSSHGLLNRGPMSRTTKSPSIAALNRPRRTSAMGPPPAQARCLCRGPSNTAPGDPVHPFPPSAERGRGACAGSPRPSRPPGPRPWLAVRCARIALVPRVATVEIGPGELVRGHGVLHRPLVEAVGHEHHLAGVGHVLHHEPRLLVRDRKHLAGDEVAAVGYELRHLFEERVGHRRRERHDDEFGMAQAEQADRVGEGRLVRPVARADVLHGPAAGADDLGEVGVLLVEPGDGLRICRHARRVRAGTDNRTGTGPELWTATVPVEKSAFLRGPLATLALVHRGHA